MFDYDMPLDWRIIAHTLIIVGLFFILNSLYFKRAKRLLLEYYGLEKKRPLRSIRDHVMSMVQMVIGFVFVILGHFLLIAERLSSTIDDRDSFFQDPSVLTIASFLIGSMLLVTMVLKVFQILWTKWTFKRLLTEFYRENAWALEKFPATAKQAGEILGVGHRKEDSVAEYLGRLRQQLEIEGGGEGPASESKTGTGPRTGIPAETSAPATHPATPPRIMS